MQRINTPDERFVEGDPFNAVEGTQVTADFLNAVQEEIANAVELSGLALDPADNTQLYQVIVKEVTDHVTTHHAATGDQRARRLFFATN